MDTPDAAGVGASSNRMPKSYRVRAELETLLHELAEGDPLPSERELALRCGVARETVRQAVRELLVEGRIRRQGRGTVVSRPKMTQPLSLRSYTEGALKFGRTPGRILVEWTDAPADPDTAHDLGVAPDTPVMHLERILLADGERIGLESTFMPLDRFAGLRDTYDPTSSLYAAVRATGVRYAAATERIETVLASPREAALLECTTALPMLLLHRRSSDIDGRPVERVRSLYRGDRIAFQATLRDEV
ncbi:GntR family transcriptional regulator [Nocardia sp. 2]|uniref:GntR family transcriptional regulator n=1 Tax=Nocardia acididurans TaxID=2802282 RepID=A0ABS1MEI3_9NOCA|nr:GntR family transcriptional regulator [Nocardia acididurans]MBL1079022.1 GntR family transcriptional regulator [Nocardia acididurans]